MWLQKYKSKKLDEYVGKAVVEEIRKWVGEPLIIYGATGVGKTLLAELIAQDREWDIYQVNDENIQQALTAANTKTLFGGEKLILVEDIEQLRDLKELGKLVDETKSPLILTTRDYSNKRLATVKKKCKSLQIKRPLPATLRKYLEAILDAEGIECERDVLEKIVKGAQGDIRAAILDLEALSIGRGKIKEDDVQSMSLTRDRTTDIYKALSQIFGGKDIQKVISSTWDLSEQPKDIIWWVEENTPRLYQDRESLANAFENISKSDRYIGRILNRQYWGFLRYANALMTAGVNCVRPERVNYIQYMFPSYFSALGRTKKDRNIEGSIAEKISPTIHVSKKVAIKEYIPLYSVLLKKKSIDVEELTQTYNLTDEEIQYLVS
ncbi:MAG: hypothetical protein KKD39_03900 [Candidatus Altiarchaeota archaeon]|nr:hypothetical protein [Candidatus Altiarchaeota archaeon]